jgi:hypothetical protein
MIAKIEKLLELGIAQHFTHPVSINSKNLLPRATPVVPEQSIS